MKTLRTPYDPKPIPRMSQQDKLAVARWLRGQIERIEKLPHAPRIKDQIDRLWQTVKDLEKEAANE